MQSSKIKDIKTLNNLFENNQITCRIGVLGGRRFSIGKSKSFSLNQLLHRIEKLAKNDSEQEVLKALKVIRSLDNLGEKKLIKASSCLRKFTAICRKLGGKFDKPRLEQLEKIHAPQKNAPIDTPQKTSDSFPPDWDYNKLPSEQKEDRQLAAKHVLFDYRRIQDVPDTFKNDPSFIIWMIKEGRLDTENGAILQYLPESMRNHPEICYEAVIKTLLAYQFVDTELKAKGEVAERVFMHFAGKSLVFPYNIFDTNALFDVFFPDQLKDQLIKNKNLMLSYINLAPIMIIYAKAGPNYFELAKKAFTLDPTTHTYIKDELLEDRDFAMASVKLNPACFAYISPELQNDPQIAPLRGDAYKTPLKKYLTLPEVEAKTNFLPTEWNYPELTTEEKNNPIIAARYVLADYQRIKDVPDTLKHDPYFIIWMIHEAKLDSAQGDLLQYLPEIMHSNLKVASEAVKKSLDEYLSKPDEKFLNQEEVISQTSFLPDNWNYLDLPSDQKNNRLIAARHVLSNFENIVNVPDTFKNDPYFIIWMIRIVRGGSPINGLIFEHLPNAMQKNPLVCYEAVKTTFIIYKKISDNLKATGEIALRVINYYKGKNLDFPYNLNTLTLDKFFPKNLDKSYDNVFIANHRNKELTQASIEANPYSLYNDCFKQHLFLNLYKLLKITFVHHPKLASDKLDEKWLRNKKFIVDCIKINPQCYDYIDSELKMDLEIQALKNK